VTCDIDAYPGQRALTSLPICPIAVWDAYDGGKQRAMVLRRAAMIEKSLQEGSLLASHHGLTSDGKRHVREFPLEQSNADRN
jgi:hypothetical protein